MLPVLASAGVLYEMMHEKHVIKMITPCIVAC